MPQVLRTALVEGHEHPLLFGSLKKRLTALLGRYLVSQTRSANASRLSALRAMTRPLQKFLGGSLNAWKCAKAASVWGRS